MALYNKYRPNELSQVKGNEGVISILDTMLSDLENCPHTFLLTGPSGCGKTTIGRIIKNMLECSDNDFKEIDSADFRGIDTIRDIRKQSQYKPMDSLCRIWLLDEVHQLSKDAQNALLKILEDTPKHVYFVLCTTEPDKLLSTLKNRCQHFEMKPLNNDELFKILRRIARGENVEISKEIYDQIILDSFGSPRAAIQILEKVINCPEENRMAIAKQTALETSESIALCRALIERAKWAKISKILIGLKTTDPESIRRHVLGYAQTVLLTSGSEQAAAVIEAFWEPTYNIGFTGIVFMCFNSIN